MDTNRKHLSELFQGGAVGSHSDGILIPSLMERYLVRSMQGSLYGFKKLPNNRVGSNYPHLACIFPCLGTLSPPNPLRSGWLWAMGWGSQMFVAYIVS